MLPKIPKQEYQLVELIKTDDSNNIELALRLASANKIELLWYRQLYDWLYRIGKIGVTYSNQEKMIYRLLSIVELNYHHKQLKNITACIAGLHNLTALRLYSNELKVLPDTIGRLSALKTLILTKNQISTLPTTIGQLTNLEEMWLGFNQLNELPKNIALLSQLKSLYLQHNKLHHIDEGLLQSEQLKTCYIFANPLQKGLLYYQQNYPACQFKNEY